MKKAVIVVALLFATSFLSGCIEPRSATYEGKTYVTGFYGDEELFPHEFKLTQHTFTAKNTEFHQIEHQIFDLYRVDVGGVSDVIYCEKSQYDEVCRYYSDSKNFSYYCRVGRTTIYNSPDAVELKDIDTSKLDALLEFANNSEYRPFDSEHNEKVEKIELPMPDDEITKPLEFYKVSNDLLFISNTGHDYYIIDGMLYFAYQYNYGRGEYKKLIAVKVPPEISEYIVDYMKPYLENEDGYALLAEAH